jgi:hypothetical protein
VTRLPISKIVYDNCTVFFHGVQKDILSMEQIQRNNIVMTKEVCTFVHLAHTYPDTPYNF